jgi:Leucine-rich repeat (LRR) protein
VTQPQRRPRRTQFALKSLLGLMLLVALAAGWLSYRIRHRRYERQAVTAIGQMGGEVIYSYWWRPEWLVSLLDEDPFLEVTIVCFVPDSSIDDDGLAWLRRFPQLSHLDLTDTRITDAGLAHLRELTELHTLRLSGTQVSDMGVAQLANLSQIEELDLSNTRVTNACLDQLADLPQLWDLDVTGTQVTHAGIEERFGPKGPRFIITY